MFWASPGRLAINCVLSTALVSGPWTSHAFDWSVTELQFQYRELVVPDFLGGRHAYTPIVTLQHADGWRYGENFLFLDYLHDAVKDGFNDDDLYGEWYGSLSISKLFDQALHHGIFRDVGVIFGINAAADAKVFKWLPGVRVSWDIPGFSFLNSDFMAYLDGSRGLKHNGAPRESHSWMIDINWGRPFTIGTQKFSLEGHAEYAARRHNELGFVVNDWILAQPQLRWDTGHALWGQSDCLFLGIEYQYWWHKLGGNTDENTLQLLVVLRY